MDTKRTAVRDAADVLHQAEAWNSTLTLATASLAIIIAMILYLP